MIFSVVSYRLIVPTIFLLDFGIGQLIFGELTTNDMLKYKVNQFSSCPFLHTVTLETIGLMERTILYCSSMDAIETVASPTFFCKIQGWSLIV